MNGCEGLPRLGDKNPIKITTLFFSFIPFLSSISFARSGSLLSPHATLLTLLLTRLRFHKTPTILLSLFLFPPPVMKSLTVLSFLASLVPLALAQTSSSVCSFYALTLIVLIFIFPGFEYSFGYK